MTPLLPEALRQAFAEAACTFAWQDAASALTWYETDTFGKSHLQRRGVPQAERPIVTPDAVGRFADRQVWLVQSIFCSPRSWWQHLAAHLQQTVVPVFIHRGCLVVGPGFALGGNICPTCAALRLAQAFPYPHVFSALLAGPLTHAAGPSPEAIWALLEQECVASFAAAHSARLLSGDLASLSLAEERAQVQWHRIIPPPGDHPLHEAGAAAAQLFGVPDLPWPQMSNAEAGRLGQPLTDAFVGPLLTTAKVPNQGGEPQGIASYVTITGHLGRFTRWHSDVSGSGLAFSEEQARGASLGEAVERYSGNYIPPSRLHIASEHELRVSGRPHVSFTRFRPFTPEQEVQPSWPFAAPTSESRIPWVEAAPLGEPEHVVLLPAEAVFLDLARVTGQQSRIPIPLAGIAAHTDQEAATTAALLELIERDATMLWWHGGLPAKRLVALPRALEEQLGQGVPQTIRQWYLLLETDMPAFVVGGCLYDAEHAILVIGFAARPLLADAVRKAIAEAWQLRRLSLQLLDRGGELWRDIDVGRLPMPARPFRTDRKYKESFRPDFADMHQLTYNLQYFLDPATHEEALARLRGVDCSFTDAAAALEQRPEKLLPRCVTALAQHCEHAYRVTLATPDMGALGLTTIRIACPGLVGNTPTAFLPLSHPRLQHAVREWGAMPYLSPMPHA